MTDRARSRTLTPRGSLLPPSRPDPPWGAPVSMRAVFAEKVAAGQMRAADVATHPERNALLAVLNGLEIPRIDESVDPTSLKSGDMVIAASDGLLTLTVAEISKEMAKLTEAPVIEIVRMLLSKVEKKANPKQDNTTIAIIRV